MKRPLLTVGVSFFSGTFLALFFGLDGLLPSLLLLANSLLLSKISKKNEEVLLFHK